MLSGWMIPAAIALGMTVAVLLFLFAVVALARRVAGTYQESVLDSTSAQLSEIFIFMDAARVTLISAAATLFIPVVLYLLVGHVLVAVGGALACLFGPRLVHQHLKVRRRKLLIRQLPDTLDSLVGALRAGMSLPQSLALMADQLPKPSGQEFALVVRQLRMGVALDAVLDQLEARIQSAEYTMFTTSLRIARELGGNLTESLERLADTMRKKLAMEDKIDALTSQGKMQGRIVGCLPLFLMWVFNEMEPVAMAPLFNTMIGYCALGLIFALEVVGFILIRKIVRIDV